MANKVFCFEAPLQLGIHMSGIFQEVEECVVLMHFVEALPVLFQGPHIQLMIGIQKCLSQGHGVCKFSISGNDFHRIPQAHKLFQAFSCQDHVHLLWQPAVGKESFDDRDQSWQQVLSFTTLDIKICSLAPRFLGVCEHAQPEVCEPCGGLLAFIFQLNLFKQHRQPFPRLLLAHLSRAFSPAAIVEDAAYQVTI